MSETKTTDTTTGEKFETTTCGRCGGSGRYSYCSMYGDRCFKCSGAGRIYTKRGLAASRFYTMLLSKPVSELKPGMLLRTPTMSGDTGPWTPIESITIDTDTLNAERYGYTPMHITFEGGGGYGGLEPTKLMRVGSTVEEKQAARAKALEYQKTLTKTGTVRKEAR